MYLLKEIYKQSTNPAAVNISSTHNVYKNNQHWDAETFDDKEASLPY